MSYAPRMYVEEDGTAIGASRTDQAGCRGIDGRTRWGRPVISIGKWWPSQMGYAPYRRAVARGQERAQHLAEQVRAAEEEAAEE